MCHLSWMLFLLANPFFVTGLDWYNMTDQDIVEPNQNASKYVHIALYCLYTVVQCFTLWARLDYQMYTKSHDRTIHMISLD